MKNRQNTENLKTTMWVYRCESRVTKAIYHIINFNGSPEILLQYLVIYGIIYGNTIFPRRSGGTEASYKSKIQLITTFHTIFTAHAKRGIFCRGWVPDSPLSEVPLYTQTNVQWKPPISNFSHYHRVLIHTCYTTFRSRGFSSLNNFMNLNFYLPFSSYNSCNGMVIITI